jgi:hypothetical protein
VRFSQRSLPTKKSLIEIAPGVKGRMRCHLQRSGPRVFAAYTRSGAGKTLCPICKRLSLSELPRRTCHAVECYLLKVRLEEATTPRCFANRCEDFVMKRLTALWPNVLIVISLAELACRLFKCFPLEFVALPERRPVP